MYRINAKVEVMDKEIGRNNVVVQGWERNTKNKHLLKDGVQDFLKKHLGVDVKNARKIWDKTCLMIQLKNTTNRIEISKNIRKFRNIKDKNWSLLT
jgi:hypothetical protein